MNILDRLQQKWQLNSLGQVLVVLLVFAATGTTILFLKRPIVAYFTGDGGNTWFTVAYYILILPIYNVFLLFYGFLFGQFSFFWEFEKKTWRRMTGKGKKKSDQD